MKSRYSIPLNILLCLGLVQTSQPIRAQSPITSIAASYTGSSGGLLSYLSLPALLSGAFSSCASTSYTYSYNNGSSNQFKLTSFNANGVSYLVAPTLNAGVVRLRRVNNSNVSGNRSILYMETTSSSALACPTLGLLNFKPPYIDVMEDLLNGGNLNQGTDNVFTNAGNGDGNNNNIERVDIIFSGGLNTAAPSQAGFAIFDRGVNYAHDAFRIAAITGLDASGAPNSFGAVKICTPGNGSNNNGSWGHPSTANGNKTFACYVLRKDATDTYLKVSSNVNQEIGGVFFSFADLGINAGQTLYGYALLGPDGTASPSSTQLLDLSNAAVYPTNTTEAAGGGLDLVAVNTVFATASYVVLPLGVTDFTGQLEDGVGRLQWRLQNADGHEQVWVQRSEDGLQFTTLGLAGPGSYTDNKAISGGNVYYRLEIVGQDGQISYSQVLFLHGAATVSAIKLYPTMLDHPQSLTLEGLSDGIYTAAFTDVAGRQTSARIQVVGRRSSLNWPNELRSAGMYWVTLHTTDGAYAGGTAVILR